MVLATGFRDQIAKPLVGQFMRIDVHVILVHKSRGIYYILIGKYGAGSVFHPCVEKILNGHLLVVLPRIRNADFSFQKVKNIHQIE